jgi:hypothetical protein
MKSLIALALLITPVAAFAQKASTVTINSETLVVKQETDAKGQKVNKLYPAKRVVPGNVLVIKFSYNNTGTAAATGFAVNTKLDPSVEMTDIREKWAIVSVDGGKSYGALATLKIKNPDGSFRGATTKDVTNIRWTLAQPLAGGTTGDVMYYGIVR